MTDPVALSLSWRSSLLIASCTPGLAAGVALVVRPIHRRAGAMMLAFVAAAVVSVGPQIIGFSGFYDRWPNLTFVPLSMELYLPGLFYGHAALLMTGRFRRAWLWLAPGLVQSAYYTFAFLWFPDHLSKWAYNDAIHEPYVWPLELFASLALTFVALRRTVVLLRRYRRHLEATQSIDDLFDPRWIRWCVRGAGAIAAAWGGLQLVSLATNVSYFAAYPVHVVVMVLVSTLALGALSGIREPFPQLHDPQTPALPAGPTEPGDSSDEVRPEHDWQALGERVQERIRSERWFTESRLAIADVARRMATNETYVSRALNEGLGMTFRGCVNELRVQHACDRLRSNDDPVLAVGLAAGFASKSTFNRVFREATGQTPTQYRASQKPENGS